MVSMAILTIASNLAPSFQLCCDFAISGIVLPASSVSTLFQLLQRPKWPKVTWKGGLFRITLYSQCITEVKQSRELEAETEADTMEKYSWLSQSAFLYTRGPPAQK